VRKRYPKQPSVAIEDLGLSLDMVWDDPLEELARYGARVVLMSMLEAEVTDFLGARPYERSRERSGSRNGRRPRKVSCGVGALELDYPKVRDTGQPFRSRILEAWQRKSQTLLSTLPSLYTEGLSTRDFDRALSPLWKETSLSRSTVSRANSEIKQAFQEWRKRSLADEDIIFLFLDGHYEGVRFGVKEKEAILVAHGVTRKGKRRLLGIYLGSRESTESWKMVIHDLNDRGLRRPLLVISDGNPGLIRAVKEVWPSVSRQRCVVHRMRNILARIPKKEQQRIRRELNRIFYAPSLEDAQEAARQFAAKWQNIYPNAVETLGRDLDDCLTFFRLPQRYWKRIRTSNSLERTFREVRRRTRVIGRFPTEMSALSLIWAVMDQNARQWRGFVINDGHLSMIETAIESLAEDPIAIQGFEEVLAA
jgi:putative transposase